MNSVKTQVVKKNNLKRDKAKYKLIINGTLFFLSCSLLRKLFSKFTPSIPKYIPVLLLIWQSLKRLTNIFFGK